MENPNLRSDSSLGVNVSHWRSLRSSNDLQSRRHFRINLPTHVGCFFLSFLGEENHNLSLDWSLQINGIIQWPTKWTSFQNTSSYTCEVSFPRFFGTENPNLSLDWSLEVNGGHWGRPMTSIGLQNGGHFRIHPLTPVGCPFLCFLGWRTRIWSQIEV